MTLNQHELTIISSYFPKLNDYISLIKTCKEYRYILENYKYNPIYFKNVQEALKIFPEIETFNDYFCIEYNGYIITNPYFLSLYSAFKIVLPKLLLETIYEKKECEEYLNDPEYKNDLRYLKIKQKDLYDANKIISILQNYEDKFNLKYEIDYSVGDFYYIDSSVTFDVNGKIFEYKTCGTDDTFWNSIDTYSKNNEYRKFIQNVIDLQINKFKDFRDNWKHINTKIILRNKDDLNENSEEDNLNENSEEDNLNENSEEDEIGINKDYTQYDLSFGFYPKNHFKFKIYNPKLIKIMNILTTINTDYECYFKPKEYSIFEIIRILLKSTFEVGFSGSNYTDFIFDIDKISDEELIIMLAALLNIQ